MKKMWDGRFNEASSELLEEFNASIFFDKELFKEDIAGSKAHAKMLGECANRIKDTAVHLFLLLYIIRFNFNKRIYGIFQSKGITSKKGRNVCSLHTNNSKPQE